MRRIYVFQFSVLLLLATLNTNAQTGFTLGVKGGLGIGDPKAITSTYVIDLPNGYQIQRPGFNRSTGQIGLIGRYDFDKSYLYSEVAYWKMFTEASIRNVSGGGGVGPPEKQSQIEIGGGVKPLPGIRLYGGLGTGVLLGDPYDKKSRNYHESSEQRLSGEELRKKREVNEIERAFTVAPNRTHLYGKLGLGFDAGGFMIDLAYQRSLTPYFSNIEYKNQSYDSKINYGLVTLSLAYRLFPISKFLTAPRKNKIAAAQKAAIPFYKNEYSFVFGKEGEDIGSANVYENTYTRYFVPRLGVTVGVSAMTEALTAGIDYYDRNVGLERMLSAYVEAKFRPVYTLKHRVGIAGGLNLSQRSGVHETGGSLSTDQFGNVTESVSIENFNEPARLGFQTTADYQYLITKKIGMGVWLRVNGEGFTNSFAQFGVKTSFLF